MKLLKVLIAFILLATSAMASDWTLVWDASTGATGYEVSYKPVAATVYAVIDTGAATQLAMPAVLTKGTRYEFFVRAYTGTGATKSYSGESDHLRWTYPKDPIVVEMPAQPQQIIINFQ